jgi:hypothetical protein
LLGWAQPIIDFIFWAHMIRPVYVIKPFDPVAAVTLIIVTAAIGYIFGFVGGRDNLEQAARRARLCCCAIGRARNARFFTNNAKRGAARRSY